MNTLTKRFKYFVGLGFAGLLVASSLFAVLAPATSVQAAPADTTGTWIDNSTIRYAGNDYKGPTIAGANWRYTVTKAYGTPPCNTQKNFIEFDSNPTLQGTPANPGFFDGWGATSFGEDGSPVCGWTRDIRITLSNTSSAKVNATQAQCGQLSADQAAACVQRLAEAACPQTPPDTRAACIKSYVDRNAAPNSGALTPEDASTVPDPELECGVSWNPLTWMLCPFVHMINAALVQLDTAITNLLSVEQNKIFSLTNADGTDNPTGQGYYLAWKSFRAIALGILVIGALVMIVGQALGFEVLDPYTVKKILPRLIVAIIGIALSWDLMKFFVGFTNDLGEGVRSMIYFPFKGMGNVEVLNGGGSSILTLLLSGGLLAFGIAGLLSFGLTALLAIFIAFMVLVLRQLVIIVLILFAPIAIACYILPNTQGVWKLWYESFTKALMMFPIIMAFLAVGRVMALTSSNGSSVGKVVALIAYVLPYFLIPLTFRFAGGALRTLGGFVNDQGRGGFDRLKKYRGNTIARRGHEWKGGSLYQDRGPGKLINNLGRRAAVGTQGHFGVGGRGRAALATAQAARVQETLKNNPYLAELKNNDDANAVVAFSGGTTGGAKEALRDLKSGWHRENDAKLKDADEKRRAGTISATDYNTAVFEHSAAGAEIEARGERAFEAAQGVGFSRENAAAALQTVAQNKSRAVGAGDIATVQNGITRLSGANATEAANAAFSYQYFSRESGRGDLGGNWVGIDSKVDPVDIKYRQAQAAGHSDFAGMSQPQIRSTAARDVVALDGMGRTEVPAMVRGHSSQLKQNAAVIKRMMNHGSDEQKQLAAIRAIELQKNMSYGSGDNQKIINELMKDINVDYTDIKTPIEEQVAVELGRQTSGRSLAPGNKIDGTVLTRAARTYDRETYDRQQQISP